MRNEGRNVRFAGTRCVLKRNLLKHDDLKTRYSGDKYKVVARKGLVVAIDNASTQEE